MKDRFPFAKLLPMLDAEIAADLREIVPDIEGAEYLRKSVCEKTGAINEDERSVTRAISTRDIDRDGEILVPKGAMLEEYLKNPVVLYGHDYSSPPHAKAEWVKAGRDSVQSKTVYAETPKGEEIWTLVKGGFQNAASVGFIPVEYVDNPEKKIMRWNGQAGRSPKSWEDVTARLAEEWQVPPKQFVDVNTIYTKWLLLEYSDVPVPSNASALIARGYEPEMLKRLGYQVPGESPGDSPEPTIREVRRVERERYVRQIHAPAIVRPVRDVRQMTEDAIRKILCGS